MVLDEDLFVAIEEKPEGWLFTGLLEHNPDWKDISFWQDLLARNLTLLQQHGATISYEPSSGAVLYASWLPLSQVNSDYVYEFLEKFVNQLDHLSEQIEMPSARRSLDVTPT